MTHYAFVDVETTGLDPRDSSIVEIGIVSANERGEIFDRYETLINPLHRMAATKIHGIRATAIAAAPTFELIAADVADRLDGAIVVAYNAGFDSSFVDHAMRAAGGYISGDWTCAMAAASTQLPTLSRRRLGDVASTLGLAPDGVLHSASTDADLCARVFFSLPSRPPSNSCKAAAVVHGPRVPPMTRSLADDQGTSRRPISSARSLEISGPPSLALIAELQNVFADNVVTLGEAKSLSALIDSERLTAGDVLAGFNRYLEKEITAVLADGVVDAAERLKLRAISHHLGYPAPYVERLLSGEPAPTLGLALAPGMSVVFTGFSDEDAWDLTLSCAELGLAVRHGVSMTTDLVIYDGSTSTGKATKAAELSIPLMPLADFRAAIGVRSQRVTPTRSRSTPSQVASEYDGAAPLTGRRLVSNFAQRIQKLRAPTPSGPPSGISAGWFVDPAGRNQWRWFDGTIWTATVANDGIQENDPL